jgi:hypothetical protein
MNVRHVGACLGGILASAAVSYHAQSERGLGADRQQYDAVPAFDSPYGVDSSAGMIVGPAADRELGHRMVGEMRAGGSEGLSKGDTVPAKTHADDGSSGAPICVAQHVSLLQGYRVRPPWRVAGVDYCVGYSKNTVLKDPARIAMTGTSVNATSRTITVTANNVTLDGYDFSRDGGWQVSVQAENTSIVNSNFKVGSNDLSPIISTAAASNMTVAYCTIDGDNRDPEPWGGLISYRGNGFTVEYSWLKNSGGDMIQQISGGGGSTVTVQNNLIQNGGMVSGAHGDYTQLAGGPFNVNISYNTTVQDGGSTQGLQTAYASQGQISHNTMIGSVSYFTSVDLAALKGTFTVQDNYYDPSKAFGFVYPNSGPNDSSPLSVFIHNVDMRTGAILQDANAPGKIPSSSRFLR